MINMDIGQQNSRIMFQNPHKSEIFKELQKEIFEDLHQKDKEERLIMRTAQSTSGWRKVGKLRLNLNFVKLCFKTFRD